MNESEIKVQVQRIMDLRHSGYYKFTVGKEIWLVPGLLATDKFRSAIKGLNETEEGELIPWSDEERNEFRNVRDHDQVWRPI